MNNEYLEIPISHLSEIKYIRFQSEIPNPLYAVNGIYFLCNNDIIVYIGKSNNIFARVFSHVADKAKDFNCFWFLELEETDDKLLEIESFFIQRYSPFYNKKQFNAKKEFLYLLTNNMSNKNFLMVAVKTKKPFDRKEVTINDIFENSKNKNERIVLAKNKNKVLSKCFLETIESNETYNERFFKEFEILIIKYRVNIDNYCGHLVSVSLLSTIFEVDFSKYLIFFKEVTQDYFDDYKIRTKELRCLLKKALIKKKQNQI